MIIAEDTRPALRISFTDTGWLYAIDIVEVVFTVEVPTTDTSWLDVLDVPDVVDMLDVVGVADVVDIVDILDTLDVVSSSGIYGTGTEVPILIIDTL